MVRVSRRTDSCSSVSPKSTVPQRYQSVGWVMAACAVAAVNRHTCDTHFLPSSPRPPCSVEPPSPPPPPRLLRQPPPPRRPRRPRPPRPLPPPRLRLRPRLSSRRTPPRRPASPTPTLPRTRI